MDILAILSVGLLVGFLSWLLRPARRPFTPAQVTPVENKVALRDSLARFIDFLRARGESHWATVLTGIQHGLASEGSESDALAQLSELFGGMGSLNDFTFEADQELADRLLDSVFRDMKLYHGTAEDRAAWAALELTHAGELPPRIKHSFRP